MHYCIKEGNLFDIRKYDNTINIDVKDFYLLFDKKYIEIIEGIIFKENIFYVTNSFGDVKDSFFDYITNNITSNEFIDCLTSKNIPLYSLFLGIANRYKRQYEYLCSLNEATSITFICNKDNIYNVMCNMHMFKCDIIIDSSSMSLIDYKSSLNNFDFNSLDKFNILVYYQDTNSPISPKKLYEVASFICDMTDGINKYNLSPVEKVMYVYDIVKEREYKESDDDRSKSRDLDKIISGDKIVCVGYSNLFNAILNSLGINAIPLVDFSKKHQRSLVYIKDYKYNIDGIFEFDMTGDSKRNIDYINNYRFFGLNVRIDDRDVFGNVLKNFITDFYKYVNMEDKIDVLEEYADFLNKCEFLFQFAGENFSLFLYNMELDNYIGKENSKILFKKFLKKFRCADIKIRNFIKILYSVRRIEYYNGMLDDFEIDDMFNATIKRYKFLNKEDLKRKGISSFECLLESFLFESELTKVLEKMGREDITLLLDGMEIERDKANLKLVKVLRNRQKQLTEEKK